MTPHRDDNPGRAGLPPAPIDFTFRYEPGEPRPIFVPENWQDAEQFLWTGNHMIARFYEACRRGHYEPGTAPPVVHLSDLEARGEPIGEDGLPRQYPFVAIFGCADARVPTEILFGQEFNDIFNIRVAGNVLAEEGIGSLLFALRSFVPEDPGRPRSLRGVVVLGHRGCGAVKGAVQASLAGAIPDDPIGSILRRIADPPLAVGMWAFDEVFGTGAARDPAHLNALVDLVVYVNAAWGAHQVRGWVDREGPEVAAKVGVAYGVFDPGNFHVRARPVVAQERMIEMFGVPPRDRDALDALALDIARSLRPA